MYQHFITCNISRKADPVFLYWSCFWNLWHCERRVSCQNPVGARVCVQVHLSTDFTAAWNRGCQDFSFRETFNYILMLRHRVLRTRQFRVAPGTEGHRMWWTRKGGRGRWVRETGRHAHTQTHTHTLTHSLTHRHREREREKHKTHTQDTLTYKTQTHTCTSYYFIA